VDTFGHIEAWQADGHVRSAVITGNAPMLFRRAIDGMKSEGLEAFRAQVVEMSPFLSDRVTELKSWDDVKLLQRHRRSLRKWWRPGLMHRRCGACDVADRRRRH
jgi:hypothetical protein